MITEIKIMDAIEEVFVETGVERHHVGVIFKQDPRGGGDWTVQITYRQAHSRKGYHSSLDGYGETPAEAAKEAIDAYRRAVEFGLVATP
jgi:hypothetical protein